jgi:hypothetical protein
VEVVVSLIWNNGLASRVQLLVTSVTAVTRTWEELSGLTEPAHKYKQRKVMESGRLQIIYTTVFNR